MYFAMCRSSPSADAFPFFHCQRTIVTCWTELNAKLLSKEKIGSVDLSNCVFKSLSETSKNLNSHLCEAGSSIFGRKEASDYTSLYLFIVSIIIILNQNFSSYRRDILLFIIICCSLMTVKSERDFFLGVELAKMSRRLAGMLKYFEGLDEKDEKCFIRSLVSSLLWQRRRMTR